MNKGRILMLVGSILLIISAFLPWISVPNLFGVSGPLYEGIEAGWEGDGVLTAGAGLVLVVGEFLFGREPRKWQQLAGIVLAALAATVVLLDFRQILEIAPKAGFFAATDIGIYLTLTGAILAMVGCVWRRDPAARQQKTAQSGSLV